MKRAAPRATIPLTAALGEIRRLHRVGERRAELVAKRRTRG